MVISVMLFVLHQFFGRLMFFDGISGMDTTGALADAPGLAGYVASGIDSTMGLLTMIFLLAVYLILAFLTVIFGSQLISGFGDMAMDLIGAGLGGNRASGIADKALMSGGLGYMGARSLGAGAGKFTQQRLPGRTSKRLQQQRALPNNT